MSGTSSAPTYLVHHPSGYQFRYCIPKDVFATIGKSEQRYSLKSRGLSTAKRRARAMDTAVQRIIKDIRNGGKMSELFREQVNQLLNQTLKQLLEEDEEHRVTRRRVVDPEEFDQQLCALTDYLTDYREQLAISDYSQIADYVDKLILEPNDLEIARDSDEYKKLCRELLKVMIQVHEIAKKRELGDYSYEIEYLPEGKGQGQQPKQEPEKPSHKLSEVIEWYLDEMSECLAEKTQAEYRAALNLFLELFGDVQIETIDRTAMGEAKKKLRKLPPNMRKAMAYRDKAISEILKMKGVKPMSPTTVNKNLIRISSFFNWAIRNGYLTMNPAEGMQLRKSNSDSDERKVFSIEDLEKLFGSDEYLNDSHRHSYGFWTPIIPLYCS